MPSSTVEPDDGVATGAVVPSRPAVDERLVSSLRTQAKLDLLCKKHGIPSVYTPRPAGDDRRACTPPPPGSICVYAHALEAGMRVPLQGFFCEVLAHYGIAPAQLMPNGWRVMAGFLALCRTVGVPPSLAVFRRSFVLSVVSHKQKGWYCFPVALPRGVGEPSKSSFVEPVLIGEEKKWEAKILGAYGGGGAPVDINTCLSDGNLAGAMVTARSKGMDPAVYDMMKAMLAEKASASTKKVKAEPGSNAPGSPSLCGNKRSLELADGQERPTPAAALNTALPSGGVCSPPPGFSRKPEHFPSRHGGHTTDWKAARELLQAAVAPPQDREFAAREPSDVVKSSYGVILQAVKQTTFSLSYALELEEKLVARDAEVAALRAQLEKAKAELAVAKAKVKLAVAKRPAAVQHLVGADSEEHVRRRAEQALEGHDRWQDDDSSSARATDSPTTEPEPEPVMHPSGRLKRRQEPSAKYDPKHWLL
uniref:Uncharacterized protein n=1 Tax=Avena sativa TaxID=4498 RepID=A0ACD6AAW6_AVESA